MIKKIVKSNEFMTVLILVILSVLITLKNPNFFSWVTIFDVLRASTTFCMMGFGVLMVIIYGGVDISFTAIASMSAYAAHVILRSFGYQGGIEWMYVTAIGIGILAGLLNGVIIAKFKLPVFDVTLATSTMWYGFTLFFLGSTGDFDLPKGMVGYYANYVTTVQDPVLGTSGLHVSVIFMILIGITIFLLLKYTTFGRSIYAIGGNKEVAVRSGFNVNRTTIILFVIVGALAAIAGVTQSSFSRYFNPVLFQPDTLTVIAAIILGGAAITGGRGSVIGTFLGVILLDIINRGLILTGIPPQWQKFVVGLLLVIFITIPAVRALRAKHQGRTIEEENTKAIA